MNIFSIIDDSTPSGIKKSIFTLSGIAIAIYLFQPNFSPSSIISTFGGKVPTEMVDRYISYNTITRSILVAEIYLASHLILQSFIIRINLLNSDLSKSLKTMSEEDANKILQSTAAISLLLDQIKRDRESVFHTIPDAARKCRAELNDISKYPVKDVAIIEASDLDIYNNAHEGIRSAKSLLDSITGRYREMSSEDTVSTLNSVAREISESIERISEIMVPGRGMPHKFPDDEHENTFQRIITQCDSVIEKFNLQLAYLEANLSRSDIGKIADVNYDSKYRSARIASNTSTYAFSVIAPLCLSLFTSYLMLCNPSSLRSYLVHTEGEAVEFEPGTEFMSGGIKF